jgi:hypothetical protein
MNRPVNDEGQLPADNRLALRQVVRGCRKAALGSLMAGAPYCSLVTVAVDGDLSPLLLLSELSDHTRNIQADARVSLLFDGTDGHANPQTGPRVTLTGRAVRSAEPRLMSRFLDLHPGATRYAGFADFAIWRVVPERAHFVGGFGRAVWFDTPFGLSASATASVAALDPPALANGWSVLGVDCDGCDVVRGDSLRRLDFPQTIGEKDAARDAILAASALLPL